MSNFLQEHYNNFRRSGGRHGAYVAVNDVSDELADELKGNFEALDQPVSNKKVREFSAQLRKEAEEAELDDDIAWLTGTGRYSQ